jgi:6-phosphofructokinase 1
MNPMAKVWPNMNFVNPDELVKGQILVNDSKPHKRRPELKEGCVRANAARNIYWEPSNVKAAIVTCGGLCPGLNSIIREVTLCLWHDYGIRDILGITSGFNGLSDPLEHPPEKLDPSIVREIHMKGGSILKAGRGGFDAQKICDNCEKMGINMVFVVGGDGTQSAGNLLYAEARKRNMEISVVGIPKSIDNDVLFIDKTFGYDSAVATASDIIRNAWVEATSCEKACSIVKLMGREAGFVAMNAALASTIVDVVLVPEVKFKLEDVHEHIWTTIKRKGHCVVAVAEGAGQEYVATGELDATGHTKFGDIGVYINNSVNNYLKQKGGRTFYIDPSYIIRSCVIRPNDHIYCGRLAHDAVHVAMRGYTGVCVGALHNVIVIFPSKLIACGEKRRISCHDSFWQSCVQSTKMPKSLAGLEQPRVQKTVVQD